MGEIITPPMIGIMLPTIGMVSPVGSIADEIGEIGEIGETAGLIAGEIGGAAIVLIITPPAITIILARPATRCWLFRNLDTAGEFLGSAAAALTLAE